MPLFRHSLSPRDAILIVLGATIMNFCAKFMIPPPSYDSIILSTHIPGTGDDPELGLPLDPASRMNSPITVAKTVAEPTLTRLTPTDSPQKLPETVLVHHAPGYTLFRNLYMSDGTLFIVTDDRESFPEVRFMTSTGLPAEDTPENIAQREPTTKDMDFISPEEAKKRWDDPNKIVSIDGDTLLVNDPRQFLRHYYHFVAELIFGVQAFWHGAFSKPSINRPLAAYQINPPSPRPIQRITFVHSDADGWRDDPGFNAYFLRAAYPSVTVECQEDWDDRVKSSNDGKSTQTRAWYFPGFVLLVDRSAAFRGSFCGSQTQRTASEAWEYMKFQGLLAGERVGGWWEPVRAAVLRFAGAQEGVASEMQMYHRCHLCQPPGRGRRKLTEESHKSLVNSLQEMSERRGIELILMEAEKLSKDEQLRVIARTTILLGVHGNGLTHLVFMPPTRASTVIEIFCPGGFAHDYHWTTRALGMSHFAVWNDTAYTYPNEPEVDYPEGFQENHIPVHGPAVVKIIVDRVDGLI
ncbi:hypothetical protein Moror_137 [Moniliophthora roreri MCA 2997]|uniref:Glycosyltransferase 61 catalytic domain-containing protein n=1 Tax=Moniliophthora roreri (strain MCA 2997) TaxID=1381753 RepID=V2XX93_MONRO|nr:hypothetical protein Moror_137 [Moniliophthora roreri MCA 2997]